MSEAKLHSDVLGNVVQFLLKLGLVHLDFLLVFSNHCLQLGLRLSTSLFNIRVSDLVLDVVKETKWAFQLFDKLLNLILFIYIFL